MKPLSHSSLTLYLECPLRYKYKYLDKLPEQPRHFFSFGKSLHSALEFFYDVPLLPPPSLEEVLAAYHRSWRSEGYRDPAQASQYLQEGERILREFYSTHIRDFRPPLFCEYSFQVELEGVPVVGYVDRIDKLSDGSIGILDYKTGKAFDLERVRKDPQLTLYQMACRRTLGLEIEALTLYHLPSNTPFTTSAHPKELEEAVRDSVRRAARGIESGRFEPEPDPDRCRWCDFKRPNPTLGFGGCPAWRDEFLTPEDKRRTSYGEVPIEALVDRYGELKEKAKVLDEKIRSLREEIEKYFADTRLYKVSGRKFTVHCDVREKWDFEGRESELESLLRAQGLWERVFHPASSAIQGMLKDDSLDPRLKSRLEQLGRKETSRTLRVRPLLPDGDGEARD